MFDSIRLKDVTKALGNLNIPNKIIHVPYELKGGNKTRIKTIKNEEYDNKYKHWNKTGRQLQYFIVRRNNPIRFKSETKERSQMQTNKTAAVLGALKDVVWKNKI